MALHNSRIATVGTGKHLKPPGHDSNPGTADEAKKSFSQLGVATGDENVIGAGDYSTTSNAPAYTSGSGNMHAKCDGFVVIRLGGTGTIKMRMSYYDAIMYDGVWDCVAISSANGSYQNRRNRYINCSGTIGVATSLGWNIAFYNSVFIGGNMLSLQNGTSSHYFIYHKANILDSSGVYQVYALVDSFVSINAVVQFNFVAAEAPPLIANNDAAGLSTYSPTGLNMFCNCNINGLIRLPVTGGAWKDYAIQDLYTGTPQDNGYAVGVKWLNETNLTADGFIGTIAGWNAVVATMINRNPGFNDSAKGDYTLRADSEMIGRGFGGVTITGRKTAVRINTTDHGIGDVTVIASTDTDVSVPSEHRLKPGSVEGFTRFIKYHTGPLKVCIINAGFLFNTDTAGGSVTNNNVPDAEPLTATYAKYILTLAAAGATNQLIVATGKIVNGNYVNVLGEIRLVTGVAINTPVPGQDTITVGAAFRAIVGSGVEVTYGTEAQIAVLNPNRLTFLLRTSSNPIGTPPDPSVDSDWDNGLSPGLGYSGVYFQQEHGKIPGLIQSGSTVWGSGDSSAPALTPSGLGNCWIDAKVVYRNNQNHKGLPG